METPERRDPQPLEVDLTETEGNPTPHAALEIALRLIGFRLKGTASLPSPVMLITIGLVVAALIIIGCAFAAEHSKHDVLMVVLASILALVCIGVTTSAAFVVIKTQSQRRST